MKCEHSDPVPPSSWSYIWPTQTTLRPYRGRTEKTQIKATIAKKKNTNPQRWSWSPTGGGQMEAERVFGLYVTRVPHGCKASGREPCVCWVKDVGLVRQSLTHSKSKSRSKGFNPGVENHPELAQG